MIKINKLEVKNNSQIVYVSDIPIREIEDYELNINLGEMTRLMALHFLDKIIKEVEENNKKSDSKKDF